MIEQLIDNIQSAKTFTEDETFLIYKRCSELIIKEKLLAQRLLVYILDFHSKFARSLDDILADLIEAIGFYPYLQKEDLKLNSTGGQIRQAYHHSDNIDKYLHEDQKYLLSLLNTDNNVIVSAPTSFGKSLLIEEIVAANKFSNIIIIQPTLALLDETRRKLMKYTDIYKLIVRTTQEPSTEKGNVFLFTGERVNEYKEFPHIDFLIIDEFYKLSTKRDDERADSLNNAFYYILKKFKSRFYLLGPNIDGISEGFAEKYNAIFYKTQVSLVYTEVVDLYTPNKEIFDNTRHPNVTGYREAAIVKEEILFELLLSKADEQSIIYCSSPRRVRELSQRFLGFLIKKEKLASDSNLDIIQWIEENVSPQWSLISLLKHGIGIHDGALQKHITTTIIDYFNKGYLKYLFCTTTIIEGVNTSAKNVIFFDRVKGRNTEIDYFDYSNIKGRAGRLMIHYTGVIYNFNPVPEIEETIVDIPFFEQNPVSDEILINIKEDEVRDVETDQYKHIENIPGKERDVIKNNGVLVKGQESIFLTLRADLEDKYELIAWSGIPDYEQLKYCIELAWSNLLKPGESTPFPVGTLVYKTNKYGRLKSLRGLIEHELNNIDEMVEEYKNNSVYPDTNAYRLKEGEKYSTWTSSQILEEVIRATFQIHRHWFQYKIPKWLSVINSIQEFVCEEKGFRPGNYSYYANLIENGFARSNLILLTEFGVPSSAIMKLEKIIPATVSEDDVIEIVKGSEMYNNDVFIEYERNKLKEI